MSANSEKQKETRPIRVWHLREFWTVMILSVAVVSAVISLLYNLPV